MKQINEKKQRMIEEEQEKSIQENQFKKLNISTDLKRINWEPFVSISNKLMSCKDQNSYAQENNSRKEVILKIKNVDWFTTNFRKSIENNTFNVNEINLYTFNEIHDNLKRPEQEINQSLTSVEANTSRSNHKWDNIKEFITQMLVSK